jgi:hypothetical protein
VTTERLRVALPFNSTLRVNPSTSVTVRLTREADHYRLQLRVIDDPLVTPSTQSLGARAATVSACIDSVAHDLITGRGPALSSQVSATLSDALVGTPQPDGPAERL